MYYLLAVMFMNYELNMEKGKKESQIILTHFPETPHFFFDSLMGQNCKLSSLGVSTTWSFTAFKKCFLSVHQLNSRSLRGQRLTAILLYVYCNNYRQQHIQTSDYLAFESR